MATVTMSGKPRKERAKKPRRKFFTMTAIKTVKGEASLIQETYEMSDEDAALKAFTEQHKIKPATVVGPYMRYQGPVQAAARVSISIKPSEIDYTKKRWSAIFQGWRVLAHGLVGIRDAKDDENVFLFFEKAVTEGAPRPRFGSGQPVIRRDLLEDAKAVA